MRNESLVRISTLPHVQEFMLYNDWDYVGDEKGVGQSYGDLATSIAVGGQVIRECSPCFKAHKHILCFALSQSCTHAGAHPQTL